MKNIVTQIVVRLVEKILENFEKGGLANICTDTKEIEQITSEFILELISQVIEYTDEEFCKSKLRKETLLVQQKKVERRVLMPMGELFFRRTVYRTKDTGEYVYPIDVVIGLQERERITSELSARLIQGAASRSYEKSSEEYAQGKVTRQTVKNKVAEVGELAKESSGKQKKVEKIDIYADEDHVHMQDKGSQQVPLVVVSEGKKTEGNRKSLINPIVFQGYGMKNETFWEGISAYLREEYDIDNCSIVVHSDGAKRMKMASEKFMNVTYAMDEFHITKHIKGLCAGEIGKKYGLAIRTCIDSFNLEGLKKIKQEMMKDIVNYEKTEMKIKTERKRIKNEFAYFINNWQAIERRKRGTETGSCTEGQVSHILSERLSRSPMGWSKTGLSKMAMIRVYVWNGGKVQAKDVGKGRNSETIKDRNGIYRRKKPMTADCVKLYQDYAAQQVSKIFDGNYDWSIFDKENQKNGKVTGTSILMKAYGKAKIIS